MTFPIGYNDLHPDVSMNYRMNRFYGSVGEPEMLEEMRMAASRIATCADWKREFVALAERASLQGHVLRAGFYWRWRVNSSRSCVAAHHGAKHETHR